MKQRISISPRPPRAGESLQVCYDFGSSEGEAQLSVQFLPSGEQSCELESDESCCKITVPKDATQITVEDKSGSSPDLVFAITGSEAKNNEEAVAIDDE